MTTHAREGTAGIDAERIERAAATIAGAVRATPLLPAGEVSRRLGAPVALKAENLQRTGSFKIRGAQNKLAELSAAELERGVVAASAGNHAQAVAVAARERGAPAELFMPADAPLAKVEAVRRYGGQVRLVEGSYESAAAAAHEYARAAGATLVHPYDDLAIAAGQGTVGIEIAAEAPQTRLVVVAVGGGGLAAGVAIAIKARLPGCRVVGVQAAGRLGGTICDGIAVKNPGELTTPLLAEHLDALVTVSDDEVAEAMVLLLERSRLVVEGAGAAPVAALLAGKVEPPASGAVCAVLSGSNVDATRLAECIRLGETAAGRRLVFTTVVPDRPGALAELLGAVAELGANVLDVAHIREGVDLHVRETAVRLVLQTDGRRHGAEILEAVRERGFPARTEGAVE
jgi:threonine dehydratase